MASISNRPPTYSGVGGSLKNPIEYVITSSNTSEVIEVRDENAAILFSKNQSVRGGSITLDIAKQIRSLLTPARTNPSATFNNTNTIQEFYIFGNGFDDTGNRRFGVLASFDTLSGDMSTYVTGNSTKKFTTTFKEVEVIYGLNCFLSVITDNSTGLRLRVTNYDQNKNILSQTEENMNIFTNAYLMILIPFVFGACTADVTLVQDGASTQLLQDPNFATTSGTWNISSDVGLNWNIAASDWRLLLPGSDPSTPRQSKEVYQDIPISNGNRYTFSCTYNAISGQTHRAYFYIDSVLIHLEFGNIATGFNTISHTFTHTGETKTARIGLRIELDTGSAPPFDIQPDAEIELTAFTFFEVNVNQVCETKNIKYLFPCDDLKVLTWQNRLGGWDQKIFNGWYSESLEVDTLGEHLDTDERQISISGKMAKESIQLTATNLVKSEYLAVRELYFSRDVRLWDGENLTKVVVQGTPPSINSRNKTFDMTVTVDLPYVNAS